MTVHDTAFRATILEAETVCYNMQCRAVWPEPQIKQATNVRGFSVVDVRSSLLSTIYDAAFRATILEAKTVCYNIQCSAVWPLHSASATASAELTQ